MSEEKAVYLSNAAAQLPSSGHISQLKSHLLWVSATTTSNDVINQSIMCPKCCQVWNDGKFTLHLKSSAIPGPRMVKILRKFSKDPEKLNKVEKSLMERYQKNIRNKMVLLCLVCNAETVSQIKKRDPPELHKYIQTPVIEPDTPLRSSKKKKKDRFAGLNVSAVLSATPSPSAKLLSKVKNTNSHETLATRSVDRSHHITRTPTVPSSLYCTPRPKVDQTSIQKGSQTGKQKMNLLREGVKRAQQGRVDELKKARTTKNLNVKRNNNMQNFLKKAQKDVKLEDRINSLLQM